MGDRGAEECNSSLTEWRLCVVKRRGSSLVVIISVSEVLEVGTVTVDELCLPGTGGSAIFADRVAWTCTRQLRRTNLSHTRITHAQRSSCKKDEGGAGEVGEVGGRGRKRRKERRWERRKQMTIRRNLAQTHLYRTGLQIVWYSKVRHMYFIPKARYGQAAEMVRVLCEM